MVHIKDFDIKEGNYNGFRYPFEGDMDFKVLVEALRRCDYHGYLTAELPCRKGNVREYILSIKKSMDKIIHM